MDNSGATAVYTPPVTSGINTMSSLRFRKLLQKMDLTDYITPETKMIDIEQDAEFQKFMNFHEGASNSETISKKLSAEKESIIINDPHVSLSLASFWDFRVVGKQAGYYVFFSPYMFGGNTGKIHTSMTSGAVDT
jgi:acyl-homoserine lactone acylase PvdQ